MDGMVCSTLWGVRDEKTGWGILEASGRTVLEGDNEEANLGEGEGGIHGVGVLFLGEGETCVFLPKDEVVGKE